MAILALERLAMEPTIATLTARVAELEGENARLREALTPSDVTRTSYSRFYFQPHPGDLVRVPWEAVTCIMAAISRRAAAEAIRNLSPPPNNAGSYKFVPKGWKVAPIEPDQNMVDAWAEAAPDDTSDDRDIAWATADWKAMLKAAPLAPTTKG